MMATKDEQSTFIEEEISFPEGALYENICPSQANINLSIRISPHFLIHKMNR